MAGLFPSVLYFSANAIVPWGDQAMPYVAAAAIVNQQTWGEFFHDMIRHPQSSGLYVRHHYKLLTSEAKVWTALQNRHPVTGRSTILMLLPCGKMSTALFCAAALLLVVAFSRWR
jgi:hypothetical protein